MKQKLIIVLVFLLIHNTTSTIWDNIFSQTQSPVLLQFTQSFSLEFDIQQQQATFQIDYNSQLSLFTVKVSKTVIIIKMELVTLQINLQTFITSVSTLGSCQRYQLEFTPQKSIKNFEKKVTINQKKGKGLFPILFKYIGNNQGKVLEEMRLDLLTQHKQQHSKYQRRPVLLINQNGKILKIYKDKNLLKQIDFTDVSTINGPIPCSQKIKKITMEQLRQMIADIIENKDQKKIPS